MSIFQTYLSLALLAGPNLPADFIILMCSQKFNGRSPKRVIASREKKIIQFSAKVRVAFKRWIFVLTPGMMIFTIFVHIYNHRERYFNEYLLSEVLTTSNALFPLAFYWSPKASPPQHRSTPAGGPDYQGSNRPRNSSSFSSMDVSNLEHIEHYTGAKAKLDELFEHWLRLELLHVAEGPLKSQVSI